MRVRHLGTQALWVVSVDVRAADHRRVHCGLRRLHLAHVLQVDLRMLEEVLCILEMLLLLLHHSEHVPLGGPHSIARHHQTVARSITTHGTQRILIHAGGPLVQAIPCEIVNCIHGVRKIAGCTR